MQAKWLYRALLTGILGIAVCVVGSAGRNIGCMLVEYKLRRRGTDVFNVFDLNLGWLKISTNKALNYILGLIQRRDENGCSIRCGEEEN